MRLYAPFIGVVLAQVLIIVMAPSRPPSSSRGTVDAIGEVDPDDGVPGSTPDDATPGSTPDGSSTPAPGTPGSGSTGGPSAGGSVTVPTVGGRPIVVPPGAVPPGTTPDTSHCTKDGRQHDVIYQAPPCVPKWPAGADNGGATATGVTATEIKVLFFREEKNPVVEQLINKEGLSRTVTEEKAYFEAAVDYLNKRYELYGRKIKPVYYEADCPETPPDVPRCRDAAREAIRQKPFAVVWPVPLYPEVFDDFYRAGIVAIGGWHFDNAYFAGRHPYRWDVFMDGSRTADFISEYYCKKLAGKNATHSGAVIHPSFPNGGRRGEVPRKLGIIVPDTAATVDNAKRVAAAVGRCGGGKVEIAAYASNIEQAQRQASANVAQMIDNEVTTVICFGEPIAPIFRTTTMTQQTYFPEHLLAGSGLIDYDKLGRLYDRQQWSHAFGPSHLSSANQRPLADTDTMAVWRDAGRSGTPCEACGVVEANLALLGTMLQSAGPRLNAGTIERGMLSLAPRGGWAATRAADKPLASFGRNDYTLNSDIREVWWNPNATSGLDGRPGAYVALDGGRRYELGQLDRGLRVPVGP
jgi:hypothetical protein